MVFRGWGSIVHNLDLVVEKRILGLDSIDPGLDPQVE